MNKKTFFRRFRKTLYNTGLVIGLLFLIYQLTSSVVVLVQKGIFQVKVEYAIIALFFSLFVPPTLIIAWKILLLGWKVKISLRGLIQGFSLSFLPRYIPGTVWGYLSRNEWFYKEYGVDYKISNTANILEIFVALCSGLLVVGVNDLIRNISSVQFSIWVAKLIVVFLFVFLFSGDKILPARFISEKISISLNVVRYWVLAVIVYIVQWAAFGLVVFFTMKSVSPMDVPLLESWPTLSIDYFVAWAIGLLVIFVPSGIGVREFILSSLLNSHFALIPPQANLISVIVRLILTLSEFFWVIFGILLARFKVDTP